jgi:hypothetical protein
MGASRREQDAGDLRVLARSARPNVPRRHHIRIGSALGRQHADLVAGDPTARSGVDDAQFDGMTPE